ncbi:hypothetical protein H206_05384 [Candidatus Electrothrix aarhusensis]|uniref:Uncharacterized protein n=1 Tax=Candidatus Electrothrix aarhusensis TaxID=1859131 RepID=A0A444J4S7_9BACT|nr:hypothetical protein H206_05384 [Candidatus Electrothrix aarhusensis]
MWQLIYECDMISPFAPSSFLSRRDSRLEPRDLSRGGHPGHGVSLSSRLMG